MLHMARHAGEPQARLHDFVGDGGERAAPVQRARIAILLRHRRKDYFDHDLFADPAWDMLLHLFVAYEEQATISIGNCCAATTVPEVAAMRWVEVLEERGLLTIFDDAGDPEHRIVRMTDPAHHAMRDFWAEQRLV